ncbi:MAG: hypothetical protein K2M95_02350, partial [Clostridiales bacterium]|nr:hypothetical protein [Clostridiales bacterium]
VETVEKAKPVSVNGVGEYESYDALVDARKLLDESRPSDEAYKENGEWKEGGEEAYRASEAYKAWSEKAEALKTADIARDAEIKALSQAAVVETYGKTKEGFLWVSNIWSPDVPWRKSILSYNQFKSNVGNYTKYNKVIKKLKVDSSQFTTAQFQDMMNETTYNKVTGVLSGSSHNRANGYLILPILSVALSFLSQFITTRLQKKSGQLNDPTGNSGCSMKMMMFIMPIMMGAFALNYTSMFTLYIVVNSAMTVLINVFTSLAINGKSKHTEKAKTTGVQKYGRPDPKDL